MGWNHYSPYFQARFDKLIQYYIQSFESFAPTLIAPKIHLIYKILTSLLSDVTNRLLLFALYHRSRAALVSTIRYFNDVVMLLELLRTVYLRSVTN